MQIVLEILVLLEDLEQDHSCEVMQAIQSGVQITLVPINEQDHMLEDNQPIDSKHTLQMLEPQVCHFIVQVLMR